jgi:signal transduction histidine kinase
VQYQYEAQRIHITGRYSPERIMVEADRIKVADIVQNLLDNACKYSPARSTVEVSVTFEEKARKNDVYVAVQDHGKGIDSAQSTQIWTAFERGVRPDAAAAEGLGLGLYVTYLYVSLMGGDIWFYSRPEDGTQFTVRLPIASRTEQ